LRCAENRAPEWWLRAWRVYSKCSILRRRKQSKSNRTCVAEFTTTKKRQTIRLKGEQGKVKS